MSPYLKDVHPDHIELIRDVQPFVGGPEWSGVLRDLSNADRHRLPVEAQSVTQTEGMNLVAGEGEHQRLLDSFGYVHALVVFTTSGKQVFETLEALQREVTALVDEFNRLFRSFEPDGV
ncbi:MAG: hypothetical protein ACXVRI_12685 [Gaiellaceae bacterium]